MINKFIIGDNKNEKVELKDVKLIKNSYGYCLDMTYRVEDDTEIREVHIPYLQLPISPHIFEIRNDWDEYSSFYVADVGFGPMRMFGTVAKDKGETFIIKVIKEKTKEMTLAEIEKKLGHKVKIVNK